MGVVIGVRATFGGVRRTGRLATTNIQHLPELRLDAYDRVVTPSQKISGIWRGLHAASSLITSPSASHRAYAVGMPATGRQLSPTGT